MGCTAAERLGALHDAKAILLASPATGPEGDSDLEKVWYEYTGDVAVMIGAVELKGTTPEEKIASADAKYLHWLHRYPGHQDEATIVPDKMYGSFEDGSGFICLIEYNRIHEAAFVSTQTIGNLLEYGQMAIGDAVPNYIDADNQVWPMKDYAGLFGIFAWFAFVIAFALLLIEEVPAFACVRRPLARNVGFRGKGLVVATIVGLLAPYLVIKTDAFGIVGGGSYTNLKALGFNLGFSNMGFGVVVGLSIVCTIGLVVYVLTERRKKGLRPADFGITPYGYDAGASKGARAKAVAGMVLKSLLVAAIAVGVGFAYAQLQTSVLGTDFYAWFFGVKDIPISKIPNYMNYLVVFVCCFVVLSIDMNVIRRLPTTGSETRDTIVQMVVNVVVAITVVIAIVAVKWWLQSIGSPADTGWLWGMGLDTQRIWGLPVGMTVAAAGSTLVYRKTGNIWLCALLVGTIACMMGVLYGGTRFHYLTYFYS